MHVPGLLCWTAKGGLMASKLAAGLGCWLLSCSNISSSQANLLCVGLAAGHSGFSASAGK
jgi:hypothetical protein